MLNVTLQFTFICCVIMLLLFDYGRLLVDALHQSVTTMGAIYWRFNADTCRIEVIGLTEAPPKGSERRIDCECHFNNYTVCHVVKLYVLTWFLYMNFLIASRWLLLLLARSSPVLNASVLC